MMMVLSQLGSMGVIYMLLIQCYLSMLMLI